VILYGIASAVGGDIEIWTTTREDAEATLAEIVRDEPDFDGDLWVEPIEFEQSPRARTCPGPCISRLRTTFITQS